MIIEEWVQLLWEILLDTIRFETVGMGGILTSNGDVYLKHVGFLFLFYFFPS